MHPVKLLIASVLKPVNDIRMYEKIGTTLGKISTVDVHIIGAKSRATDSSFATFYPIFSTKRWHFSRFFTSWNYFNIIRKVKPEVCIITTHELLIVTCVNKILFGGKIIYDVQENYAKNALYGNTFPIGIRQIIAGWVRLKELMCTPFIDAYLCAEKCYLQELPFILHRPYLLLENKPIETNTVRSNIVQFQFGQSIRFLFSGTLSTSTGVLDALHWVVRFHSVYPATEATFIGYCSRTSEWEQLKKAAEPYSFVRIIGGNSYVKPSEILSVIPQHHFGLLAYQVNPATQNRIPTKLYDYLYWKLPILYTPNTMWEDKIKKVGAGWPVEFTQLPTLELVNQLLHTTYFTSSSTDTDTWEGAQLEDFFLKIIQN